MNRTTERWISRGPACLAAAACLAMAHLGHAANLVTWESANSLIDTTNYTSLGPNYWFANFGNPSAVTGAAMDDHEARNTPSWLHLESRPAFIGKDDSGLNADGTQRTGFSFEENDPGTVGDTSIGGQAGFNTLTLPGGSSTGVSGQAVDSLSATGNTSTMLQMRILAGAPSAFRMWVVTDNGSGANFHAQARLRVSLRNTSGAPLYSGDLDTSEAEALPSGLRLITTGSNPQANNGIADAWAFKLSDVNVDDIVSVRPSSAAGSLPGFAGIIIQAVPEPSSMALVILGTLGATGAARRRRRG